MLMIIYLIAAMILTPIIFEYVNTKIATSGGAVKLQSLPAYVINLILCGIEALIGLLAIPSEYNFSLYNLLIFTALIYLGNQIVFNLAVKIYSRARSAVQHGGTVR